MLYTQIENNQAKYSAITLEGLVILGVISSVTATTEQLTEANIVPVTMFTGQAPTDGYEYKIEIKQQSDGTWAEELIRQEISDEKYQNIVAKQILIVKADRDKMLGSTDWIVTKNIEAGTSVPEVWKIYRQSLRDIPSQEGYPWTIIWPTRPTE